MITKRCTWKFNGYQFTKHIVDTIPLNKNIELNPNVTIVINTAEYIHGNPSVLTLHGIVNFTEFADTPIMGKILEKPDNYLLYLVYLDSHNEFFLNHVNRHFDFDGEFHEASYFLFDPPYVYEELDVL